MRTGASGVPASGGGAAPANAAAASDASRGSSDTPPDRFSSGGSASGDSSSRDGSLGRSAADRSPTTGGGGHRTAPSSTTSEASADGSPSGSKGNRRSSSNSDPLPASPSPASVNGGAAGAAPFSLLLAREGIAEQGNDPAPAGSPDEPGAPQPRDTSDDLTTWVAGVMPSFAAVGSPESGVAAAAAVASDAFGAMGASADASLRSSGPQRALQMLLAQSGTSQGAAVPNSNAPPAAAPAGSTSPPSAPSPDGAGIGVDSQPTGNSNAQGQGSGGGLGSTTSTDAAVNVVTTANALDAANALNPAGAALAGPMQATATMHLSSASASSNVVSLQSQLRATVGTSEWADELGGQLTWMAHHGIGSASLQVSPPELGPIEVRIAVHGSAASVWFGAAQADTRTALEQALPRLHELFGAQGLALADASVSREPPREQRESTPATWGGAGATPASADSGTQDGIAMQRLGLLDLYA
jgi:flagellar hook-length control protein FliK